MKNSYFSIQKTFYWKKGIGPTFESIAEMVFVFIKLGNLSWEQSTDELFETWLRAIERSQLEQRTLWQSSRAEFLYRGLFIILWDIGKLRHTLSTPLRLLKTALSKWRAFGTRGCAYHELRVAHLVADDQTIRHLAAWLKRHPGAAADDLCCQRHPVSKLLWSLFLSPDTGQTGSWNFSATSDVGGGPAVSVDGRCYSPPIVSRFLGKHTQERSRRRRRAAECDWHWRAFRIQRKLTLSRSETSASIIHVATEGNRYRISERLCNGGRLG